ncbi:MAG: tetratricopeptide repeat protein [Kofleriaceae bacterium]|nr:tetratricopeptide repeat protein [Kofleriaceae bacterium]
MRADPTATNAAPLDPRKAAPAIAEASDRKRIFELLLRATRTKARFAALLSVHANEIRGQFALGDAAFDTRAVSELRIPRNSVPTLEKAISSGVASVGTLATGEPFIDGYLDGVLGRPSSHLLLPIAIGNRTVAVVAAHRGDATFKLEDVQDLESLFAVTGEALARVLATRGRAATVTTGAPTVKRPETRDDGYEIELAVPDVEGKRKKIAAHRREESWKELAQAIRDLVRDGMETGEPGEDEQLELLLELGNVEADKLGRSDRAIEAWKSAQTIDAGEPRVLDALERVFVRQGQWEEYADVLEKKAALADGVEARIGALMELGTIARERLDDDERAIGAYERILSLDGGHARAGKELEALYTDHARWQDLIALLLDRASRHDDPKERLEALMSVAHLYEVKVGDGRDAFLVWLTVFRREPERPHLIEQLARLADNASHLHEVVAETRTLADELAGAHPKVAAELWQLLGAWQRDRMGNRDAAAAAFEQAARLDPEVIGEAADALRADERWPELAALLVRRVEAEADAKKRAQLCCELGELYDATLGQPGEAIRWYERARDHDPSGSAPLVALHRLYLDSQAWHALGELLPKLIETLGLSAARSVIVDLYVELGQVLGQHLGRPEEAIEAYREAIALDEKNVAALKGLAEVYAATGQTEALLDTTEDEIDAAGGPNQVQRYADIAAAWYELARRDRAIACWRKLLAIDPGNIGAHKGLARALRDDEQWAELAVAQKAQLKQTIEPFERIVLLLEMAELLERQFDNVDGAIASYREVLGLDSHNRTALDALGRLYDRAGQWQPALDMLQRMLAEVAPTDRKERAALLGRIGHVHLGARDAIKADASFGEAIALDPDNAHAHEGMGRVLLTGGKLAAAAEKLLRAAQLAKAPQDTIRLLADAAWVYRYRSGDNEQARACLERILQLDPENADAKQALAELLHDTQEWATLWPHLEQQAARARTDTAMAPAERAAILAKAARCALELGKFTTSIELYDLAIASDSSPAIQLDRAEALYRSKSLEAAAAAYQTVAALNAKTMERTQLASVYRRLGAIQAELGKVPQAIGFYGKVLDLEPNDPATHDALAELHLAGGRYDDAVASLRSRAALAPPAERIRLLERIGNLYRDKLANPARAMSAYLDALAIDKADHRVLQRVLDLQSETGQWKAAIETIDRFLELESDRSRRGAYLVASAEIRRTHLKDAVGALALYETALDEMLKENPLRGSTRERALDAFNVLRELVGSDAKYLEQTYRRMIKRLPKDDPAHVALWDGLGDIYRLRLDHPQSAIEAFELAHTLDPEKSGHRTRILAELYAKTGTKRPAQASERAAKLVEVDPTNADPYHALRRTALAAGRTDEAWCVSRALVFLKQADKDEQALYRRYQQLETRKARGILDDDAWSYVRHADEDLIISTIFSMTWEAAVSLKAGPAKAFELKPKERLAIEESTGIVAKIFKHASRLLNVPLPDVYVQPRRPGRLLLANCIEKGRLVPAVIVGRDLMTGYRDTEIAASVGAMIALLRPAYYLKLTLSSVDELEAALHAAALAVGRKSRAARPELEQATNQIAAELQKRLTRSTGETLLSLVQRLPEKPDLAAWRNSVDAAAQRAGLLVSGDLAATARMISSEAAGVSAQRPTQRVQELVAYSVSPAYFAARRHLQVTVD